MEFICTYPNLPLNSTEENYLCLFGFKDNLSELLRNHLKIQVVIDEGLNYSRFQGCLIATCAVDNKNIDEKKNLLTYLTNLFKVIIYELDLSRSVLSTSFSNTLDNCPLSKLYMDTYVEIQGIANRFEISFSNFEASGQVYFDSSFCVNVKKQKFDNKKFQEKYTTFIKSLNIFNTRRQKFNDLQRLIELSIDLENLGLINVKPADIRNLVEKSERKVDEAIRTEKTQIHEKLVNYLLGENNGKPLVKNEISYLFIKKKSFFDAIEKLKKWIEEKSKNDFDEFIRYLEKHINDFLISNDSKNDLYNKLKVILIQFDQNIENRLKEIEMNLFNDIKSLKDQVKEWHINLVHAEYKLSNQYKSETDHKFYFDKQVTVESVMLMADSFILVTKTVFDTTSYLILQCKQYEKNVALIFEFDTFPVISFGSSISAMLIILNEEKKVQKISYGQISDHVDCYKESQFIQDSCFSHNFNTMLYVNEKKELWTYNIWKNSLIHIPMEDPTESVKICNNELLILVSTKSYIKVFTFKFEEIIKIPCEFSESYIKSVSTKAFSIYSFRQVNSTITNCKAISVSNPAKLEFYNISEDISHMLCIPTSSELDFYIHSNNEEALSKSMDFYNELKEAYKKIKIKPFKTLQLTPITSKIISNFMRNNYALIATVGNSNLTPLWNSHKVLEELSKPNIDFYLKVFELTTFGSVETLLHKAGSVKVLSLIGDISWFNHLNFAFKKTFQGSYSENIWACINKHKKQHYLCLYSPWNLNRIENLKIVNFFYAVSEIFIVAPNTNEESIATYLNISKNRFPGLAPKDKRVDVWYLNKEPTTHLSFYNVSVFSSEHIHSEIEYFLNTLETSTQKDIEVLIRTMKGVITSLFLDDDVDFNVRLEKLPNDVELHRTFIEAESENGDELVIESFQLNKNKESERCRAACPGCSAMCSLPNSHNANGEAHKTHVHRKIKNTFAFTKELKFESTCDLYCVGYNPHFHDEPCVMNCIVKHQNGDWKHHDGGKKFDISRSEFAYDKISCTTWWTYKNWALKD